MGETRTHRAGRRIAAAPDDLYDALIDPEALETWLAPPGARLRVDKLDARPGGAFRFTLTAESQTVRRAPASEAISGRFIALVPGELVLSESDAAIGDPGPEGAMRTGWYFHPIPRGTRVEVVAENVPEGISAKDHEAGLAASLANLARYAEIN